MKIDNTKLLIFVESIDREILRVIMKLIAFSKTIAARFPTEAQRRPEILRHPSDSVQSQLIQLHLELEQNLGERRMRQHPQSRGKKLFEDNNFIYIWLWHNLLPDSRAKTLAK
jgi:hypothetical protein